MRQIKINNTQAYIFGDNNEMWEFMLAKWQKLAGYFIEKQGEFNVAVAGGKTPVPFYKKLNGICDYYWDKTNIFLTDERMVSANHPDSNRRGVRHLKLPASSLGSAKAYEQELKKYFSGDFPDFDLILLGIGDDGHIASLFPESSVLNEQKKWVVETGDDKHQHRRITLTLPVINNAKNIWFLVTGEEKAQIVKSVFKNNYSKLPASLIDMKRTPHLLIIDEEVARGQVGPRVKP